MEQTEKLSLLIADDETSIRRGLCEAVEWSALGIQFVGEAQDGAEALEKIHALRPDIVITDIKMPGFSGLDLIEKARAEGFKGYFIILSGYDDFAFAQRAIHSSVTCYLLKPVNIDALLAEVKHIRKEIMEKRSSGVAREQDRFNARRGSSVMKEQFYAKLADGEFHSEDDIWREINSIGFVPIPCPCAAVVFHFSLPQKGNGSDFSASDSHLFKIAFRNVLTDLARQGRQLEFYADRGNQIGLFISPAGNLREFLTVCVEIMEKVCPVEFSVGIGFAAESLLDVPRSCRAAEEAAEYHLYKSGTHFFDSATLAASLKAAPPQPPSTQKLAEDVVSDDIKGIHLELDGFFKKILYVPMPPPRYVRGMCFYLMGDVTKRVASMLQHGSPIPTSMWTEKMDGLESMDAVRDFMLQALLKMARDIQQNKKMPIPPVITEAQKYIREHVFSRLFVTEAAAHVHLSESYFTALFKKSTGITVQEYILTCKLEKAKELLMEGKLAVSEISDKLEYKDYRSFSRVFKRFSGCSPTEYQHKMTRRQKGN